MILKILIPCFFGSIVFILIYLLLCKDSKNIRLRKNTLTNSYVVERWFGGTCEGSKNWTDIKSFDSVCAEKEATEFLDQYRKKIQMDYEIDNSWVVVKELRTKKIIRRAK